MRSLLSLILRQSNQSCNVSKWLRKNFQDASINHYIPRDPDFLGSRIPARRSILLFATCLRLIKFILEFVSNLCSTNGVIWSRNSAVLFRGIKYGEMGLSNERMDCTRGTFDYAPFVRVEEHRVFVELYKACR